MAQQPAPAAGVRQLALVPPAAPLPVRSEPTASRSGVATVISDERAQRRADLRRVRSASAVPRRAFHQPPLGTAQTPAITTQRRSATRCPPAASIPLPPATTPAPPGQAASPSV